MRHRTAQITAFAESLRRSREGETMCGVFEKKIRELHAAKKQLKSRTQEVTTEINHLEEAGRQPNDHRSPGQEIQPTLSGRPSPSPSTPTTCETAPAR